MNERDACTSRGAAAWAGLALAFALLLCFSCSPGPAPDGGSETHFLQLCGGGCAAPAACVCGVCTTTCIEPADCGEHGAQATCVPLAPRVAEQRCDDAAFATICDAECVLSSDCAWLGSSFTCQSGYCRSGASSSPTVQGSCAASGLSPEDVAVLGDSLIELSPFTPSLEQAAVAAGVLAPDAHYRAYASHTTSFLAEGPLSLGVQYAAAHAARPARVLIMNGGATDMLNDPCAPTHSPACPELQAALRGFERLLSQFAADGVEHLVYLSYPDPIENPGLKAGLDTLRPLLENACGKSRVACHWLDLRPVFAGHPAYAGPDGIVFSESGAQAAATAAFELMRTRCIAQ